MINLASYLNKSSSLLRNKIITSWLYVKHYVIKTTPAVNYLQLLDPMVFTGAYTYAFWNCKGIYKIEIINHVNRDLITGNITKVLLPITAISQQVEFKFYGIHKVITKTLAVNADCILLNIPTIQSDLFSQPAFFNSQLALSEPSEALTSPLTISNLVNDVKMHIPNHRIENLEATITNIGFRVQLPDFNTHINH